MARFERAKSSRGRRDSKGSSRGGTRSRGSFDDKPRRSFEGSSKRSFSGRSSGGRRSFDDKPRRSDSGRDFNRFSRNKAPLEMTKVTCASCGDECEVPFKPTSSKPVYCRDCFNKKEHSNYEEPPSNKGLDIINEKLDKIMEALDIR